MDCPGIVFARARTPEEETDVLLRNCVKVEKIADPLVPIEGILRRCAAEQLQTQYGIGSFADVTEFLTLVAMKRGQLRKGGAADQESAARLVLQDWNAGGIRYCTEPPKAATAVALVPQMRDEFDWNAPPRVEDDMPAADAGASDPAVAPSDEAAWPPMDHEDEALPAPAANAARPASMDVVPTSSLKSAIGKKERRAQAAAPKPQDLTDEHTPFNFQLARARRREQKKIKKQARRRAQKF